MMLMALLYTTEDRIVAAAPACDQLPLGDDYWLDYHEADLDPKTFFETAYATIANRELRDRLLMLGIDESIDGTELARDVVLSASPAYAPDKAA